MPKEDPKSELKRLREEQDKSRLYEIFGGLSPAERPECDRRSKRIYELEIEIQAGAADEKSSQDWKAEQRLEWNKQSETDSPQSEAHQPYRSRERDSAGGSRKSSGERGNVQRAPKEKGGE